MLLERRAYVGNDGFTGDQWKGGKMSRQDTGNEGLYDQAKSQLGEPAEEPLDSNRPREQELASPQGPTNPTLRAFPPRPRWVGPILAAGQSQRSTRRRTCAKGGSRPTKATPRHSGRSRQLTDPTRSSTGQRFDPCLADCSCRARSRSTRNADSLRCHLAQPGRRSAGRSFGRGQRGTSGIRES